MPYQLATIFALALCLAVAPAAAKNKRSSAERAAFVQQHPCPATGQKRGRCPGYVVDHIKPLACGGPDDRDNMQWQTVSAAKEKDRWERLGCKKSRK